MKKTLREFAEVGKFFDDLKEGFEDIIAYRKGKITLRTDRIEISKPPTAKEPENRRILLNRKQKFDKRREGTEALRR